MARIKAEVKEHAHQQRPARQQHQPPPQLPTREAASGSPAPPVVVKVEATSAPVEEAVPRSAAGWIDLTADEETEDEEDADEPFARTTARAEDDEAHHVESHQERADALDADTDEEMEGRIVMRTDALTGSAAFAPAADADETDESEVDEEMPLARPASVASPQVYESSSPRHISADGRAETLLEDHADDEMVQRSETGGSVDGSYLEDVGAEDNEEEEEDEQWPELRPQVSPEEEKQHGSPDEDAGSTASEGEDGSVEDSSAGEGQAIKTRNPLEDGEIFEEGAVVKSPTAVKEAIALELQARAAATTKKKQKKRGRKKNKRKADAMLPGTPDETDIDEFGRNVRHQPMPPAMPVMQPSHVQEFLPSMGIRSMPSPIPAGVHAPSRLPLPPGVTRPVLQGPPPPPHDFGDPHVPRQHVDDQIVRVNRHGGFEPFAFQGNRAPRLPVAAPFLPPPRQPPPYRYVSLDYFSPERTDAVDSPDRGLKRPLSQATDIRSGPVEDASEAMFDLDSLRAAALKTKRKTASKEANAIAAPPPDSVDVRGGTNQVSDAPSPAPVVQAEEDPSLDALRMELLKSMRRKRREISSQSATSATDSPSDPSSNKGVDRNQDTQVTPNEAQVTQALTHSEPLVPESPQFRPLTAMSQSIVIRLSLDEISAEQSKARADSYDDAARRFDKVLDDIRTEPAATNTPVSLIGASQQSSVHKEKETGLPTVLVSSPEESAMALSEKSEASKETAGETVETGASGAKPVEAAVHDLAKSKSTEEAGPGEEKKAGVGEQQVVPKAGAVVDADTLADPVKLEAERRACLANIREADAHIARLDAEIAALRLVITARDAEASSTSSSVTACGA